MPIVFIEGIPVFIPNTTTQKEGYYISFNKHDISTYGDVTTALVIGEQMEAFYILLGDHRKKYEQLNTLSDCLIYFKNNSHLIAPYSDKIGEKTAFQKIQEKFNKE
jgi:hypothetical protein